MLFMLQSASFHAMICVISCGKMTHLANGFRTEYWISGNVLCNLLIASILCVKQKQLVMELFWNNGAMFAI